ncbi:hypothetical protein HPP92_004692 [Vanilla planifolia]|uniref:Uncharacterized protein n=1 Tax=Vanilla planifolia TaxID=51239 RepID=A0A835RLJ1_VANPL|nr:hypothetical protein HPP92_004692 [Vanilla planifolia]
MARWGDLEVLYGMHGCGCEKRAKLCEGESVRGCLPHYSAYELHGSWRDWCVLALLPFPQPFVITQHSSAPNRCSPTWALTSSKNQTHSSNRGRVIPSTSRSQSSPETA